MLLSFRILIVVALCSMSLLALANGQKDVLYQHILEYNHIKPPKKEIIKIDSHRIFYNYHFINKKEPIEYSASVIRKRPFKNNYSAFFFILGLIGLLAIIRGNLHQGFIDQVSSFATLKQRHTSFSFTRSLFSYGLFIILISHMYISVFSDHLHFDPTQPLFLICLGCGVLLVFVKQVLNKVLQYIFKLQTIFQTYDFHIAEGVSVYLSVALPAVFIAVVSNAVWYKSIYVSVLIILILIYIICIAKVLYNELNILKNNVVKTLIYFYLVEIIPLVLLSKFLMYLSLSISN